MLIVPALAVKISDVLDAFPLFMLVWLWHLVPMALLCIVYAWYKRKLIISPVRILVLTTLPVLVWFGVFLEWESGKTMGNFLYEPVSIGLLAALSVSAELIPHRWPVPVKAGKVILFISLLLFAALLVFIVPGIGSDN